jgi:hypothetical protein
MWLECKLNRVRIQVMIFDHQGATFRLHKTVKRFKDLLEETEKKEISLISSRQ